MTEPIAPPPEVTPTPVPPPPRARVRLSGGTVVVDAGHGGRDPGAIGVGGVREKHVNLNIAREVVRRLRAQGARIVTTRSDDTFRTLEARAALADETRADLFVAIHADSIKDSSISGCTVYIARGASSASRAAAKAILKAFEQNGISCRGIREAGYRVLVGHKRPAVLVECGYLTNPKEARLLATAQYQAEIAEAITDGVVAYLAGR